MLFGLKLKTFGLVLLFTLIEAVVLAVWLSLALNGETLLSFMMLFLGLGLEHILATIAGKVEGQTK